MASNQGESSNERKTHPTPWMNPDVENREGNESGVSVTAGLGASAGESQVPAGPSGNEGVNPDASTENRSAKWKNGAQDVGAGANQFQ